MNRVVCALLSTFLFSATPLFPVFAQDLPEETVYVDRGVLAYSEKRYEDALRELRDALRVNSTSHEALYYQGLVFQDLNRPADARQALEKAHQLRSQNPDIAFQLGVLYIKQEEFTKAEPLLRQVYRADRERPNIGYYLGLIEYRKGNYRGAVELFRSNNPSDDEFAQLSRFYSGLAAGALGFPREVRAEFGESLRLRSDSPVANAIPRLNESVEKGVKEEKLFNGEIRFGLGYDTNAAVVLDPTPIFAPADPRQPGGPLVAVPVKKRSSVGELISADLSYSWWRTLEWEGNVAYKFTYVEYNQAADFSNQTHSPSLSLVKKGTLFSLPYFGGLRSGYDHVSLGHETALQRWTVNPYFTLLENQNNAGNLQFRFQAKNFSKDPSIKQEVRDALNYMVGPTHYVLVDNGRHYLKLGYQFDREHAEGRNWDYNGNRILLGAQYTLPWQEIRLRYDFDLHWRHYRHRFDISPDVLIPGAVRQEHRRDREGIHTVSVSKDFTIAAHKFNASLEYLYDNAYSNFSAFSFTRHVVIPSIAWRF